MAQLPAELDRGPALGPAAHAVQRHRLHLPAGLRLLLPDGNRRERRDRRVPPQRPGQAALRPLHASARRPPRGLGGGARRAGRGAEGVRRRRRVPGGGLQRQDANRAGVRPAGRRVPERRRDGVSVGRLRHRLADEVPRGVRSTQARPAGRPGDRDRRAIDHPRDARHQGRRGPALPPPRRGDVGGGAQARHGRGRSRQVRVRGAAGAGRLLLRQRRAPDGLSVDRRVRTEHLHAALRPEQPPDEGRRAPPERLRSRVRRLRDGRHADVSRSTAASRRSSARSTRSCSPPRRRRSPS